MVRRGTVLINTVERIEIITDVNIPFSLKSALDTKSAGATNGRESRVSGTQEVELTGPFATAGRSHKYSGSGLGLST